MQQARFAQSLSGRIWRRVQVRVVGSVEMLCRMRRVVVGACRGLACAQLIGEVHACSVCVCVCVRVCVCVCMTSHPYPLSQACLSCICFGMDASSSSSTPSGATARYSEIEIAIDPDKPDAKPLWDAG